MKTLIQTEKIDLGVHFNMSKIQIADLENVDTKSLLIELTHSEQNEINGGGLWTFIKEVASAVKDFVVDVLD